MKRRMKLGRKVFVYTLLVILSVLLCVYYYRDVLADHWLQYNINDEFIMVSSLIEPNAEDSTSGML